MGLAFSKWKGWPRCHFKPLTKVMAHADDLHSFHLAMRKIEPTLTYNISGLLNVARQPQTRNESQSKDHSVYFLVCASPGHPGLATFNSPDTLYILSASFAFDCT
jgi:hypothetical protein